MEVACFGNCRPYGKTNKQNKIKTRTNPPPKKKNRISGWFTFEIQSLGGSYVKFFIQAWRWIDNDTHNVKTNFEM